MCIARVSHGNQGGAGGETHTDFSLSSMYSQVERGAAGTLPWRRGEEAIPADLQTHGQSPLPPAYKNTAAGKVSGGSCRGVEGRLGCYIPEVFTGTCHRSPEEGDDLGWVQRGSCRWVQRGQSELLGELHLEEACLEDLRMGR